MKILFKGKDSIIDKIKKEVLLAGLKNIDCVILSSAEWKEFVDACNRKHGCSYPYEIREFTLYLTGSDFSINDFVIVKPDTNDGQHNKWAGAFPRGVAYV